MYQKPIEIKQCLIYSGTRIFRPGSLRRRLLSFTLRSISLISWLNTYELEKPVQAQDNRNAGCYGQ